MIQIMVLKLVYKQRVEKSNMESSFCSLCNKVVTIERMRCHVLFRKVFELIR